MMNCSNDGVNEKADDADILVLDCPESDSETEDGINVIINADKTKEIAKIDEAISLSDIYNPRVDDLAVTAELQALVSKSINPKTLKCVAVKFQNQIILIPNTVDISSRAASLFWAYPKHYQASMLPFHQELQKNMLECSKNGNLWPKSYPDNIPLSDKIGIFSAKYKKHTITNEPNSSYDGCEQSSKIKHSSSGIYQYCDFALLIIERGVIIDYAIHGFRSNIAECVRIHSPTKIFYNALPGDALDVFMNYKHQPFFTSMADILMPVQMHRLPGNFNPMSFCERNDVFCALCSAIKDFRGMMFQVPQQKILNYYGQELQYSDRRPRNRNNYGRNMAKNQFGQPMPHNRLTLLNAPKGPPRFKPYNR